MQNKELIMKVLDKSKIKKVALAYSGGLDTSIIIPLPEIAITSQLL